MITRMGVGAAAGETPSLTGEVLGETHRGLECAQAHPLRSQHQRGPIGLWVAEGVAETWWRVEQAPLLPLRIQRREAPRTASQTIDQRYAALVNT